jgi:hypothetical protein
LILLDRRQSLTLPEILLSTQPTPIRIFVVALVASSPPPPEFVVADNPLKMPVVLAIRAFHHPMKIPVALTFLTLFNKVFSPKGMQIDDIFLSVLPTSENVCQDVMLPPNTPTTQQWLKLDENGCVDLPYGSYVSFSLRVPYQAIIPTVVELWANYATVDSYYLQSHALCRQIFTPESGPPSPGNHVEYPIHFGLTRGDAVIWEQFYTKWIVHVVSSASRDDFELGVTMFRPWQLNIDTPVQILRTYQTQSLSQLEVSGRQITIPLLIRRVSKIYFSCNFHALESVSLSTYGRRLIHHPATCNAMGHDSGWKYRKLPRLTAVNLAKPSSSIFPDEVWARVLVHLDQPLNLMQTCRRLWKVSHTPMVWPHVLKSTATWFEIDLELVPGHGLLLDGATLHLEFSELFSGQVNILAFRHNQIMCADGGYKLRYVLV